MVYKKIKNEKGDYKDKQEVRWNLLEANEAWTPEGLNIGWTEFESKEACLTEGGLTFDPIEQEVIEDAA